jgi:hypothetical protein
MTLTEYSLKNPSEDPLDTLRGYSGFIQKQMLEDGTYDPEVAEEIDNQLEAHAVEQGLDLSGGFFRRNQEEQDLDLVSTYATDPAARQAAIELGSLQRTKDQWAATPEEYQTRLDQATLAYTNSSPLDMRENYRRQALANGNTAFALFTDADGNERVEISPAMREVASDPAAIAKLLDAQPTLDRSLLPQVMRKLRTPDGYEVPEFVLDRRDDFNNALSTLGGRAVTRLNSMRKAVDSGRTDNLEPAISEVASEVFNSDFGRRFTPEEVQAFTRDYVYSLSAPAVDEANPEANLRKLSTGEVHVPMGVMLNKSLFDKTMESPSIPAAQKQALIASREDRLNAFAKDAFKIIQDNRSEFAGFYDKHKDAGESDAAILDRWMSDPENYSSFRSYAGGIGESIIEGIGGLALYPLALAGNDTARQAVAGLQKSDADRRAYARLFGENLGVGYDLSRLVAPVAADIGVSLLTAGAASAAVGAKTTIKTALKSTLGNALKAETKGVLKGFVQRSAARAAGRDIAGDSLDNVLSLAGKDIARRFTKSATTASYLATAFNRSAGATYVQLHSALEDQKNADGSPKYTKEQAREIALNHGLLAGTITAAVTGGFSFLGAKGMERIYDGMTRRQLNGVFDRVRSEWGKLSPAVREGLDVSNPERFLESVIRKAVTPMWQAAGRPVIEEGAEEGLDEFLNTINQQVAQGEDININDAVKQAAYASFLGGVMGGTVTGINSAVRGDTPSPDMEAQVRRNTYLQTARNLDAASSPRTAAVFRQLADQPPATQEDVPQATPEAGDEQAPGEPEVVAGFRAEADQLRQTLPTLQTPIPGETKGQQARRERRLAAATARIAELDNLVANYDPNTVELSGTSLQSDRIAARAAQAEADSVTENPLGPVVELAPAPVQFTTEPGFISEDVDQIPERDGESVTRWTATDGLGTADGFVEPDGTLVISNIDAKARGTRFLDRVLEQAPTGQISVPLQSQFMQGALARLVREGKLADPSEPRGAERYPTRFTVTPSAADLAQAEADAVIARREQARTPGVQLAEEPLGPGAAQLTQQELDDQLLGIRQRRLASFGGGALLDVSESQPTESSTETPGALSDEIRTDDIFYSPSPGDRLTPEQATEVAAVLNAPNPEQAVPAARATINAYLQSKGIVTDGLSDADAAILIGAADAETVVQAFGNRQAPPPRAKTGIRKELTDLGVKDGTATFLKNIAARGPAELRNVAKLLSRFDLPDVTLVSLPGARFAGAYVPSTGQVLVNTAVAGPRGPVDTVLHELLHAATENAIANPNPEQQAVINRLNRIRQTVLKRTTDPELRYGLGSLNEFVTHAFTSPEFLKRVGDLTPKGETNWAKVIIDTIRSIINGKAFTQSEQVSAAVMQDLMSFVGGIPSRMDQVIANPEIGKVRMQPVENTKFNNQVRKYVTGNWSQDPNLRYEELADFAEKWTESYGNLTSPYGDVSIRFDMDYIPGLGLDPARGNAGISPEGDVTVTVGGRAIQQLSNDPRAEEFASKVRVAQGIHEEVIHAANLLAYKSRIPYSEDFQKGVLSEAVKTFDGVMDAATAEDGKKIAEALAASYLAYTGQQVDLQEVADDIINGEFPDRVKQTLASELLRQVVQLRTTGDMTETSFGNIMQKISQVFRKYLDILKSFASKSSDAGQRFDQDVKDTEAVLKDFGIRFQPASSDAFTKSSAREVAEGFAPEGVELTIDFDQLAADLEGMSGVNAEDLIAAMVNRDVARAAGREALGPDATDAEVQQAADQFNRTITGNTTGGDIAFYRGNPDARQRLIRYLEGTLKAMWARLKERFDFRTGGYVDRTSREIARAKEGYRTREMSKPFDPDAPEENRAMLRMQPGGGEEVIPGRYYRGTNMSDQRINEPFSEAKGLTFMARRKSSASNYGSNIEVIEAFPDAKILNEESPEFWRLVGRRRPSNGYIGSAGRKGETMVDVVNDAIRKAKDAGYDILSFASDSDIGTILLNEKAVSRRKPYSPPTFWELMSYQNPASQSDVRMQPGVTEEDGMPVRKYTDFYDVFDGTLAFEIERPKERPKNWFARMFTRRDDFSGSQSGIKVAREASMRVMQSKLDRLDRDYKKALKEENPDMDVVRQAIGSTAPLLTPEDETRINAEMDRRLEAANGIAGPLIEEARRVRDNALKRARRAKSAADEQAANDEFAQAEARALQQQGAAFDAAAEWERSEKDRSMVARAAELRRVQSLAMQQLEVNAPLTYAWANEIRETTNEMQDLLAAELRETAPQLAWTIDRSRGVYLARSYKFHQDPAMAELVLNDPKFAELREKATAWFGKDLAEDRYQELKGLPEFRYTPEMDLRRTAAKDVEADARALFEDFVMGHESAHGARSADNIRVEFQRFMQKKNLDPMISEILQEIDDPDFNASKTLASVAGILFSRKMLKAMKTDGLKNGTIVSKEEVEANPAKYRGWQPLVAADAHSQAFPELASYYAAPEDKMAWDAAFNSSRRAAKDTAGKAAEFLNKAILGAAGASLGVMTLGSAGYFTRNVLGGTIMAAAQGVNLFSKQGLTSIKASVDNAFQKGDRAFIERMIALRVLGDSTNISYLRDFLQRYRDNPIGALDWAAEQGMKISPDVVAALGKGKKGWDKMVEYLGRTAEATETIQNTAVFLNEYQAIRDSGLYDTEAEIEQEAARRTRMVVPTKSETNQAVNQFSKHPISALIMPFARFKTEMIRNVVNTYKLGWDDVKRGRELGNDVLLDHGLKRLASAAAVHGAMTVIAPLILQRLAGISDDEDKAIREAMPSYSKNSSFWYQRGDDGSIRTWDLTFSNPFSFTFDPLTQAIRAARTGDYKDLPEIIQRFVTEEFMGENVVAGNVLDVNRNRDETTGMPIWLDSDDFGAKIAKGAEHILAGSYTPATVKKIAQAYQATNRPVKEDEAFFFTPAGVLLGAVAPTKPRDYPVKDLAYRAFRNLSRENSQLWQITNRLSSPQGMAEGEATELYNERVEAAVKVWSKAHELANAYQTMGLNKRQVLSIMQDAGFSKDRSAKALRGYTDRPVIASDKLKDIAKIDPNREREVVRAMKQQAQLIDIRR